MTMVELNEKALEAAHHAYQTHGQMGDLKALRLSDSCLTAVITAYLAALPAPDDGLVERLLDPDYAGELQHLRSWSEIDRLFREAATALQSKDEQIERHKRSIQELEESVSALEAERQNIIATKREQIERLTRERDEALEAEDEAKDSFWAIYPDWVKLKGHGISTEAARTMLTKRAEAAEQQGQKLTAENERLREIVSKCAAALPNGAHINPKASLDFMAKLPAEIRSVCSALETQEGER